MSHCAALMAPKKKRTSNKFTTAMDAFGLDPNTPVSLIRDFNAINPTARLVLCVREVSCALCGTLLLPSMDTSIATYW